MVVIAVGVWGTVPHSTIAALTSLGLSVAAANAALGAALESIAHVSMLISRLRHSSPTRWRGVGRLTRAVPSRVGGGWRAYLRIAVNADAPARARIRRLLVHGIGTHEWCYSTHSATYAAPATQGPLRAAERRMQRLSHCAGSHTPLPPPAVPSTRACSPFFFFRVPTLFLAGLFRARTRTRAPARPHARTRTDDRRRTTRRAVRRRG